MRTIICIVIALFTMTATYSAPPKITFRDSYLRYASGHDLFRVFLQKFPNVKSKDLYECTNFTQGTRASLGDPNPASGELVYRAPSVPFVKWYLRCLMAAVSKDMDASLAIPHGFERFFGSAALAQIAGQPFANVVTQPKGVTWITLPAAVQNLVVTNLIETYIGPGILADEPALATKLLAATTDKSLTSYDALSTLVLLICSQDEFLTF